MRGSFKALKRAPTRQRRRRKQQQQQQLELEHGEPEHEEHEASTIAGERARRRKIKESLMSWVVCVRVPPAVCVPSRDRAEVRAR